MKTAEIAKQIEQHEALQAKVQQSQSSHAQQITDYESQRQGLFVAARAHGDAEAQKQLRDLAGKIEDVRREEREDAAAIEEIAKKLCGLYADFALAKRQDERRQLRQLIMKRAESNRPARIVQMVRALEAEVASWTEDKREIIAAAGAFDSRLGNVAAAVLNTYTEPVRINYGATEFLERFGTKGRIPFDQVAEALQEDSNGRTPYDEVAEAPPVPAAAPAAEPPVDVAGSYVIRRQPQEKRTITL